MVTAVVLTVATLGLYEGFADAEPPTEVTQRTIRTQELQLRIEAGQNSMQLEIEPGGAGEIVVERWMRWTQQRPEPTEEWDDGTLRLNSACDSFSRPGVGCEVGYTVFVPPEASVEVTADNGVISLRQLHGKVRVTTVSGVVRLEETVGDVYVRSGSGHVEAVGLRGEHADVEVGVGDVNLSFREPPTDVRAVVRTAGDVLVRVPDERVFYDVTTGAPRVYVDVRRDPSSPRTIVAETAEGRIDICCD
jgi:hypothetical protein